MACNCTTSQQIEEIYKRFGTRIKTSRKESLLFRVKNFFINTFAQMTLLTIIPLLLVYISLNYAQGKTQISLADFFRFKEATTNVIDNVR